jgi:hypothetical protein
MPLDLEDEEGPIPPDLEDVMDRYGPLIQVNHLFENESE